MEFKSGAEWWLPILRRRKLACYKMAQSLGDLSPYRGVIQLLVFTKRTRAHSCMLVTLTESQDSVRSSPLSCGRQLSHRWRNTHPSSLPDSVALFKMGQYLYSYNTSRICWPAIQPCRISCHPIKGNDGICNVYMSQCTEKDLEERERGVIKVVSRNMHEVTEENHHNT
jgi:hypothetical protein